MRRVALGCLLAVGALNGPQEREHAQHPRGYVAYRAASAIAVDGRLAEGAWLSADWTEPFVDIEGDVRPKPAYLTRVKMAWDESNFYIGALLAEPHLWATLKEHDSVIFRDNDFEVFIDPNGDNHEYYELEINALGTTWDLLLPKPYKDDGKAVNGWEIAGMKAAVNLDGTLNNPSDVDRGWTVEIALPWKALGELARRPSPPKDGDQWRVNFSRVQWQLDVINGAYRKRSGFAAEQSEGQRWHAALQGRRLRTHTDVGTQTLPTTIAVPATVRRRNRSRRRFRAPVLHGRPASPPSAQARPSE